MNTVAEYEQRIRDLLEANNRYLQRARDARNVALDEAAAVARANTTAPRIWKGGQWVAPAAEEIAEAIEALKGTPAAVDGNMTPDQAKARAIAIAAIPDMLQALYWISCFEDKEASKHLEETGSHALFDEPGSVATAREAYAKATGSGGE